MSVSTPHTTGPAALLPPGSWVIDPVASTVGFRVKHLRVATVRGRFKDFEGRIDADAVSGAVAVASVETGQEIRDGRLREEFFEADRFPHMTIEAPGPLRPRLQADLTIRDVTRPIVFDVRASESGEDRMEVHATARISREAFGLNWGALVDAGKLVVSDRVDLVLDLVLVRT